MFKKFIQKQLLKRQMANVPEAQREILMGAMEKNPEFFEKIAKEIEQKKKEGKSEMVAALEVMRTHQGELRKMLGQ
jgi:HPt (histidine-containing phosphotransfer) domain-containing protein